MELDDECDHDDHETDLLDGRCHCWRCGESWYATAEQIDAELRFQSEYAEAMERGDRRQWWSDLFHNLCHPLQAIEWQLRRRGWLQPKPISDDDIPF